MKMYSPAGRVLVSPLARVLIPKTTKRSAPIPRGAPPTLRRQSWRNPTLRNLSPRERAPRWRAVFMRRTDVRHSEVRARPSRGKETRSPKRARILLITRGNPRQVTPSGVVPADTLRRRRPPGHDAEQRRPWEASADEPVALRPWTALSESREGVKLASTSVRGGGGKLARDGERMGEGD